MLGNLDLDFNAKEIFDALDDHFIPPSVGTTIALRSSSSCYCLSRYGIGISLHNDSLNDLLLVSVEYLREILIKLRLFQLQLCATC